MRLERFVDLHTHSSASDGALSPAQLVGLARRQGLAGLALTDHDTTAGLVEATEAARAVGIGFVAGVELSARYQPGVMHILGYGIDPGERTLSELLAWFRANRDERNPQMIRKLQDAGVEIEMADVLAVAGGEPDADPARPSAERSIGRLHIAEALRRRGHCRDHRDAFERFIGRGAVGYVAKAYRSPAEVIAAVRSAGGLAVLAHPSQLKCRNRSQLETVVRGLISHGLEGIEVYHSDHSPEQTRQYLDLARQLGLAMTGGSDFHGVSKPEISLGHPALPLAAVSDEVGQRLWPGRWPLGPVRRG
jgi:hypothetical protein